jgi:glutamate dehydrogenase/leucine dehydrogenase
MASRGAQPRRGRGEDTPTASFTQLADGLSSPVRVNMPSAALIAQAISRPPARSFSYRFKVTGGFARAQLVLDSDSYSQFLGGLQIRSASDKWVNTPTKLQEFAESAARYASWKAWLAQVPVSGGKLVVTLPDALYKSQEAAAGSERKDIISKLARKISEDGHDYWARRDTGLTNDLLAAFLQGGGKMAAYSLQPAASRYTAESVIEGLAWALRMRFNIPSLDGARVLVDYSGGKVGMELARVFSSRGATLSVVDRDEPSRQIAAEVSAALVPASVAYDSPVDVFCYAGQPRQFTAEDVLRFKAKVVGGPADDLLADSELYRNRLPEECLILPGAVLTAGSLGLPKLAPESEEQVRLASREVVGNVLAELETPLCSPFEAMVIAAKRAKTRMETFHTVSSAAQDESGRGGK